MWFDNTVFYQIYTLNMVGASTKENDGEVHEHRILKIKDWSDYMQEMGFKGVYFNPLFSSGTHGYDTIDYQRLDERLGTNEDFKAVVKDLHDHDIKVVVDGVFNHVGRHFFAFEDAKVNRENSRYRDWFRIDFNGNSDYNDGFWYEGWEGHYELVKLNLDNQEVQDYIKDSIRYWIEYFDIDGIRLDVAYLLPRWFMAMISDYARSLKPDFFMLGEVIGDNADYMYGEGHLNAITDYPCYKSIWSAFNSLNLFEIAHTLKRSRGEMYKNRLLWTFLDNHDVSRIASTLTDPDKLPIAYGLLFAMPGAPCVYYGSEWGIEGEKVPGQSDDALRPALEKPEPNELTETIKAMIEARNIHSALRNGSFETLVLNNKQWLFERKNETERVIVAINLDDAPYVAHFDAKCGQAVDLITGKLHDFGGGSELAPKSVAYWLCER